MLNSRFVQMRLQGAAAPFQSPYNDKGGGSSAPPAPDYSQMAAASEAAAKLGKELGDAQLAESRRQYDHNMEVADPVIKAQLALMNQQQAQGDDYYNYMQEIYRPLERSMVGQAQNEGSDARLEEMASQAAADARRGQVQQANMLARQGIRYGYSPAKMAALGSSLASTNASQVAGAMTGARNNQRNVAWARQMDAAGLGRNLTGASQGAYGLTLNAGNSAVANSMQPGNALLMGMSQGAGMQQGGAGQRIQGLGGMLQAQTSTYNNWQTNEANNSSSGLGGLLGVAGLGLKAYGMFNGIPSGPM